MTEVLDFRCIERVLLPNCLVEALNDFSFELARLTRVKYFMEISSVVVSVCTKEVVTTEISVVSMEWESVRVEKSRLRKKTGAPDDAFVRDIQEKAVQENVAVLRHMPCLFVMRLSKCPLKRCPFLH